MRTNGTNAGSGASAGELSSVVRTDLSPRARKILLAAQRVLARAGADGLTLQAIADEALQSKSLVLYHFRSMAALEALLVDSLWHDIDTQFVAGLGRLPPDAASRIDALVRVQARIAAVPGLYEMYFDLLPSVIQNGDVRLNVARIYEAYRRDIGARCLEGCGLTAETVHQLTSLLLATGEGVPLLKVLRALPCEADAVFDLLSALVKAWAGLPPTATATGQVSPDVVPSGVGAPKTNNPARGLAEPARRILRASERLVSSGGLRSVTAEAIAKASGEPRSSLYYYFENKQGLVEALVASVLYRCRTTYDSLIDQPPGQVPSHDELRARLFGRSSPVATFLLMLPALLHDDRLRGQAGPFFVSLQQHLAQRMSIRRGVHSAEQLLPLAGLAVAAVNGLAIQALYDPGDFDVTSPLGALLALIVFGTQP